MIGGSFMDYRNTSGSNKEFLEDRETKEKMAALESIFNSTEGFNNNMFAEPTKDVDSKFFDSDSNLFNDPLEKTKSINEVDLEQLREYSKKLHSIMDDDDKNLTNNDSAINNGGKQKVLSARPKPKMYNDSDSDMSQILSSFISCSVLSFITAAMGVGFLLNIILQIK